MDLIFPKRFFILLAIFFLMAFSEQIWAKRKLIFAKNKRWRANIYVAFVSTLLLTLIFPTGSVGAALLAKKLQFGLFHWISFPSDLLKIILSIVFLDLIIYFQHWAFHKIPYFWRFHRMHHTDLDLDVTSAIRFHPIEIVLSMLIKWGVILLLGAPAVAVLLFDIILTGMAMFNHANLSLPFVMDKYLRFFIVTPDMHRVHHSIDPEETNSNYGFNLSFWDKIFGTYVSQPKKGHEQMRIGLKEFQKESDQSFLALLFQPFR